MYWNFSIVFFMAFECVVEGVFMGIGVMYFVFVIVILFNFSCFLIVVVLVLIYGVFGVWFIIVFT